MAQHTIVQLVDDLDGTNSDTVHTVEFGLDGVTYEIDLNDDHANQLHDRLATFIGSARRTGGRRRSGTATMTPQVNGSGRTREQTHAIREWANQNGYQVADRGRIPAAVIDAFDTDAARPTTRPKRARTK
jgi:hypothetical protein